MFCGICMYYSNSIASKDIYTITYVYYIQTYQVTVSGGCTNKNICSSTMSTPLAKMLAIISWILVCSGSYPSKLLFTIPTLSSTPYRS